MKQKSYNVVEIMAGCLAFLLLFIIAIKVWKIILSGKSGKWILVLLLVFLAGLMFDYFFHTGLFLANH